MYIPWRHDLRPTWRVCLTYECLARPLFQAGRTAQRLEGHLVDTGRVRAPRVRLSGGAATVVCVVKGVDDLEAAYVALAYVDSAVAQVRGLDLGDLTHRSVALHLPPTMGDSDEG